jgi:hypothetical protein
MTNELLPEELLFTESGHASDIVLTAIADGELAIVPSKVMAHVEACPTCGRQLGHVALLALHAGRELTFAKDAGVIGIPEATRSEILRAIPWRMILAGLGVALLGAIPALFSAVDHAPARLAMIMRSVPTFVQSISVVARGLAEGHEEIGVVVTFASALLMIAVAAVVARRQSLVVRDSGKKQEI